MNDHVPPVFADILAAFARVPHMTPDERTQAKHETTAPTPRYTDWTAEGKMKQDARCPECCQQPVEVVEMAHYGMYDCTCARGHRFTARRYYTHVETRTQK